MSALLPVLRPPCTCTDGHPCAVCRAWDRQHGRRTPSEHRGRPRESRATLQAKLAAAKEARARLRAAREATTDRAAWLVCQRAYETRAAQCRRLAYQIAHTQEEP